ncbi:HEPN domain-containing protein [Algoriphagus iocasae]|uniref:HEPN domain-containing protein n=1 Tax=Algoriphagus iocasae TaxID=1836499 RepID=A0A841MGC5_9BACT|nr:HEPN domain-containing protein [Algoriphagus iocasae]MBB6324547.1 HEPN domain-containing protein [Algoriphagus iocasae]
MQVKISRTDQDRAEHFRNFLQLLVEKFQPTRIISFGAQTLKNEILGCFANKQVIHHHYCLLVCTESSSRIEYEVQDFANTHYHNGQVTILCHGEVAVQEAIESKNRFFTTVLAHGKPLYTRDGFFDLEFKPSLDTAKTLAKAEKHFFHRTDLARGFLESAYASLQKGQHNVATFLMHQAVEQSCILLIRVHIDYRSEFHNLHRLLGLTRCFSESPIELMIGDRPTDKKLFSLLTSSYGKARYAPDFQVSQKDAEEIYQKASALLELTKTMCATKMEAMAAEIPDFNPQTKND